MAGGVDRLQVVAADPPQELRKPALDRVRMVGGDVPDPREETAEASGRVVRAPCPRVSRDRPETTRGAVGQQSFDRVHVVDHVPVADGAGPATVVPRHAAEGRAAPGGHVHGKEEPVRPQGAIEGVQHEAGLHGDPALLEVEVEDAVQVLAEVDDEGRADRLPALRGPASTGKEGRAGLRGQRDDAGDILIGARNRHPDGIDLVDRSVRRVASAAGAVEENLALDLAGEALRECRVATVSVVAGRVMMTGHGGFSETSGCRIGRPAANDVMRGAGRRLPGATDHTGCTGRFRPSRPAPRFRLAA